MTDNEKLAAKMKLVTAYIEKFGGTPSKATEMVINLQSTLARVHAGKPFRWESRAGMIILQWGGGGRER